MIGITLRQNGLLGKGSDFGEAVVEGDGAVLDNLAQYAAEAVFYVRGDGDEVFGVCAVTRFPFYTGVVEDVADADHGGASLQ